MCSRSACVVDHVDVRLLPDRQPAAVVETEEVRGLAGLPLHHHLQRQPRSARPVPRPVDQHPARHAGIDDGGAMRAAIRQTQDRCVIRQHGVDDVEVVFVVADDREEQEPFRAAGQVVVGDLIRRVVGPRGHRGDAVLFLRLIVRRIAHREHAVPARDDVLAELRQPVQQLAATAPRTAPARGTPDPASA